MSRRTLLPALRDDDEDQPFLPMMFQREDPVSVIARQKPDLAASLVHRQIDLEHERLATQRHNAFIAGTVGISRDHASVIAEAVHARPDRDHFRVSTSAESYRKGFFFNSDERVFTVTTQLDMW